MPRWHWLVLMSGGAAALLMPLRPAWSQDASPTSRERLLPMEVRINQTQAGNWTLLERNNVLHAPAEAFDEWRLQRPAESTAVRLHGQRWYPVSMLPGFQARFRPADQAVDLDFAPEAFTSTRLAQMATDRPAPSPAEHALFFNYDINATRRLAQDAPAQLDVGMLAEIGWTSNLGVLTSSYSGVNLVSHGNTGPPTWQRLETTFTRDSLDDSTTFRLGDLSTRMGVIGRPVFYGGLQWGRNFALQPGFVTRPVPSLAGTSTAPSTVELYINNVLRQTTEVPTGPFTLDNMPMVTTTGQVRMVVRDILGRETVVEQAFFSPASLLEAGLSDWSLEAGTLRRNLGLASARYGERFASGLFRLGLSKTLTTEVQAGGTRTQQAGGLSINHAVQGWPALLQLGVGASRSDAGRGATWLGGIEFTGTVHGMLLRTEGNTAGYRGFGQDPSVAVTRLQTTLSYRLTDPDWGSMTVGAARTRAGNGDAFSAGSLGYSFRLGSRSSLILSASRLTGSRSGSSVALTLYSQLDGQSMLTASNTRQARELDGFVSINRSAAESGEWGWRFLSGDRGPEGYVEGGLYNQGRYGTLNVDASADRLQRNLRVGAQSSLVWVDGSLFASRRGSTGMALVEVPGLADVGVGLSGREQTRTRASGRALVTQLAPYQVNSIRLNASDLPINAEIDSLEMQAVPTSRSVVKLRFPVRSGRSALLRLVLDDGQPAPAGAEVHITGDSTGFPVARRGEVYVTGLADTSTLSLRWREQTCRLKVVLPASTPDDIPRVGPLLCAGVKR